jgi:hypothetical protein
MEGDKLSLAQGFVQDGCREPENLVPLRNKETHAFPATHGRVTPHGTHRAQLLC